MVKSRMLREEDLDWPLLMGLLGTLLVPNGSRRDKAEIGPYEGSIRSKPGKAGENPPVHLAGYVGCMNVKSRLR